MSDHYENILIIKPSALGDIAMALPGLSSLRASFPGAKITWLVRSKFAALLQNNPAIDEIILFDRKLLSKWWYKPTAFAELIHLFRQLKTADFDLVIDLQGLLRTALFAWFTGCKKRFGMTSAREFATIFYTHKITRDDGHIHLTDYYEKIIIATGASKITTDCNLKPEIKITKRLASLIAEHNISTDKYVVFITGSAHDCKCWPMERFALLAQKIHSQFGLSIIAIGVQSERQSIQKLKSISKAPIANFAGLTDIPEMLALLNGANLVVSNDTGPGHLAVALGKPIVMIFGPTNPLRFAPYKNLDSLAAIAPDKRGWAIKSSDPAYRIENIEIEMVFEKVVAQLNYKESSNNSK